PSLAEFARDALSTEMGVTVPVDQGFTFGKVEDSDDAPDPEIDVADFEDLVFFMANLAPPPRGSTNPDDEAQGEKLFAETGCVGCHTPTLPTEKGTDAALYSDLLLHSVSPAGTKGIVVGDAGPTDFRTPPLWGLATTAPYMHDGRSPTIEDAVLRHDGEANTSREAFSSLSKDQRAALLSFLQSL
ncbi:MAG: c-type cytochrome, partial [Myxococcales bacterium]|nr:c-type cytochrome [Myxococcales bacterium]